MRERREESRLSVAVIVREHLPQHAGVQVDGPLESSRWQRMIVDLLPDGSLDQRRLRATADVDAGR